MISKLEESETFRMILAIPILAICFVCTPFLLAWLIGRELWIEVKKAHNEPNRTPWSKPPM
jgi:hypothetical protein